MAAFLGLLTANLWFLPIMGRGRLLAFAAIGLLLAAIAVDYAQAQVRLRNIAISGEFDQPKVIADGKSSIILTVRVTENGQPRGNASAAGLA